MEFITEFGIVPNYQKILPVDCLMFCPMKAGCKISFRICKFEEQSLWLSYLLREYLMVYECGSMDFFTF